MPIIQREYLFSVNEFKEPSKVENKSAIALSLVRLIMMDPGTDPLHPDMGVGIKKYRYGGAGNIEELRANIEKQIETYLPCYQTANVSIIVTPDKMCNIEITINDTVFVYDSTSAPIPIYLEDIQSK